MGLALAGLALAGMVLAGGGSASAQTQSDNAKPVGNTTRDVNSLTSAGNTDPEGIWTDGTTVWVADSRDDKLYAYTLSNGNRDTTKEWDLDSANGDPAGIWSDGTTMWVADSVDHKLYAYTLSNGTRQTGKEWNLATSNDFAEGIWSDETTMWVLDSSDHQVYAYTLSNGTRQTGKEWDLPTANGDPVGIWSDGTTMWVADHLDEKLYAYTLSNGSRRTVKELNNLNSANQNPGYITSTGTRMWVLDSFSYRIYDYALRSVQNDATLSGITVNGTAVPGFSRFRSSYEWGVELSEATIIATPIEDVATVTYSGTDQDDAEGHQLNLSNGRNSVTITVTAQDGTTTRVYTVHLNRSVDSVGGWVSVRDVDALVRARNEDPAGAWTDGTTMWVADDNDNKLYAYTLSTGARDSDKEWNLQSNNRDPAGIWSDGITMWVADDRDNKLYAYTLSTRVRDRDKEWDLHSDNGDPAGIWSDGTTMWVADGTDDQLYAYALSNGDRDTTKEWDLHSDNGDPAGITAYGSTMWVADDTDDQLYAYALSDGDRNSDMDISSLTAAGNEDPAFLTSHGKTLWVVDNSDNKLYAYGLELITELPGISVDGAEVPGFSSDRTSYQYGVDAARVSIVALAPSGATVVYSDGDEDNVAKGLQIGLSTGSNSVTISFTPEGGDTATVYTLNLNRSVHDIGGWVAVRDVDILISAGNEDPAGAWTDGTTLWVADTADNKLYAYTPSTRARDSDKEWNLHSDNTDPAGIWSDETTMWVADSGDDKLYAYALSNGDRDSDKEWDLHSDNTDPAGIWSDETTMWVADSGDDKLYAYALSDGDRDSDKEWDLHSDNTDPAGIWSDGPTMWVADTADNKLYAYIREGGDRFSFVDITTLGAAGNENPGAITSDGTTMWVTDDSDDKVYAYVLPPLVADLRGITVAGAPVPDFSSDLTAYEYGVDGSLVSIIATPVNPTATVAYSGTDQDGTAEGLQLALSEGPNRVSITVTLEGAPTKVYTLVVNRGVPTVGGWAAGFDIDTLTAAGNTAPAGIWSDGTTMWVVDTADDKVYAYTPPASGARHTGEEWDLHSDNTDPAGIWSDGTTMWVADTADNKLYAYTLSNGDRDTAKEWNLDSANRDPAGIWSDDTTMWVADSGDDRLYAYALSNGDRDTTKDITTLRAAGNGQAEGIWSDGTTMWVADSGDDSIYAYRLSNGARQTGKEWNLHSANSAPAGIWSDDTTMWVADSGDGKIYAYVLRVEARGIAFGERVSEEDLDTEGTGDTNETVDIWSDGTTMWVAGVGRSRVSAYSLSTKARDSDKDINLHSDNDNPRAMASNGTTMWVGDDDKLFAYRLSNGNRDSTKDIDLHSVNEFVSGMWADDTTMWVLDPVDDKLYAYTLSTKARDSTKDIDLDANHISRNGIWSDGTTIWVSDGEDRLYAYTLSTKARDSDKDLTTKGDNTFPTGVWSDGRTIWVADGEQFDIYAYALESRAFDPSIAVDGVEVPGLDPDRTDPYEVGVAHDVSQVTIKTNPKHTRGSVAYSVEDADANTDDHQFDLSNGRNQVTVTVAVVNPNLVKSYVLRVNRGYSDPRKWKAVDDFDTLITAGNQDAFGMWSDDTTMWVADSEDDKLYAYTLSTQDRDPDKDWNLHSDNADARGIWSNGTTIWVADQNDRKLYAYTLSTEARDSSKDIDLHADNAHPRGIWSNGTTIWVADQNDSNLYAYTLSNGDRDRDRDIPTLNPLGIWSDGTIMWVAGYDQLPSNVRFQAYRLSNGRRLSARDYDVSNIGLAGTDPGALIGGIWSKDDTMWMAHRGSDKIFSFHSALVEDATLRLLTVDGAQVPGLDPDRTDAYEFGVAHDVSQVTIEATPKLEGAGVEYSVTDAAMGTGGHQIDLSSGRNAVTITVTARDGTTMEFELRVNRGYADARKWKASDDIDTLIPAGNTDAFAIWSDGTTMWVADDADDKLYAYTLSNGNRDTTKEWNLHSDNSDPTGIWSDGTTMWVADDADDKLYAYTLSNGNRDTTKEWNLHSDNSDPTGIWSDNTTMWVADDADSKFYAYILSNGNQDTTRDFSVADSYPGNPSSGLRGMWSDGETMWVAVQTGTETREIRAFRLSDGTRLATRDYDLADTHIADPHGIWSADLTTWVVDAGNDKIYSFNSDLVDDASLASLTVDGVAIPGLDPDRTAAYEFGVAHDVSQVTIEGLPDYSGAGVTYSVTDADANTEGHQVDLSRGRNAVTVTVTAVNPDTTEDYVLRINRGYSDARRWKAVDDFDTLKTAGNTNPGGIWSDGTTMWVLNINDTNIEAYTLSTKARDPDKDLDLDSNNSGPVGIWSNGTTMWVSDWHGAVYAYALSSGTRTDGGFSINAGGVHDIWSNGTTMWVTRHNLNTDEVKAEAYTMSNGNRDTDKDILIDSTRGGFVSGPLGIWSDGTTMWVAGPPTANTTAIRAFRLSNGTRDTGKDYNLTSTHINKAAYLWSMGLTTWVVDVENDKIYSFNTDLVDEASLASLTVDGVAVPGAHPDRTTYEFGVAHDVAQVTIEGTGDRGQSVTFPVEDADPNTEGHQVDLSRGRNAVTVAVPTLNPNTTEDYVLRINRGYSDARRWKAVDDFDTLKTAGNTNPGGIWSDGTTMWVLNINDTNIEAYTLSTKARDPDKDLDLDSNNSGPVGIWSNGTTMWVSDWHGAVYAYALSSGTRTDGGFSINAGGVHDIWSNGTTMWVTRHNLNTDEVKAEAYTMSNGNRDTDKDILIDSTRGGFVSGPLGIWSDGTTMWVAGPPTANTTAIRAFRLSNGTRDTGKDYNLTSTHINKAAYLWSMGTTMWVVDVENDKIYSFNTDLVDAGLTSLTVSPRDIIGFDADRTSYQVGVAGTVQQATITATPDPDVTLTYSVEDADPNTEGHQVNLSDGANEVTIEAAVGDDTVRIYTVSVNRSVTTVFGWAAERDLDGLISAENEEPSGLWSDGTTTWVADRADNKLYAYRTSDGARDTTKEWGLHSFNTDPEGIWSNGTTMWVADSDDDKLYAYNLTGGARDTTKEWAFSSINRDPEGIWSNGTTIYVADSDDDKLYAYRLAGGAQILAREWDLDPSNTDPEGIWSDGVRMWVADSADGKLYAYKRLDGTRLPEYDLTTHPDNDNPVGITGDGETLWVTQEGDAPKVFAYNLPLELFDLTVDGTTVTGFDPATTSYDVALSADVREVTISSQASNPHAEVTISPADSDRGEEGHQVALRATVTPVTITLTSRFGLTNTYTVNVTHPSLTLAPVITAGDATVDEDAAIGHTIASLSAADPDGDTPLRWTLDSRSSQVFEVVTTNTAGTLAELRLRAALDYEKTISYQVTVNVVDPGGAGDRKTITIRVRDADDPGTVLLTPRIAALGSGTVGFLSDQDGGVADETWQWYRSDTSSGPWTSISGATSADYVPQDGDLGKHLRLTARYSDSLGPGKTAHGFSSGPVVRTFEHLDYCYPGNTSCDLTRAGRVPLGGRAIGRIDYHRDMDLFRVDLEEGKTYVIDVLAKSSGNGTLPDPWLTGMFGIFNHDRTLDDDGLIDGGSDQMDEVWYDFDDGTHHDGFGYSDDDGGQGRDSRFFLKHFPGGVYYIMVRGVGPRTGTYTVTFNEAVEQDPAVTSITLDTWQDASFDYPGDVDVFEVTLEANQTYSFLAERTGWWNQDRRGFPHVVQIEEVAANTVTSLTSNLYRRQFATYTAANDGLHRITLQQSRNYHHELRGGGYRVKVVANLLARGTINWSGGRTVGESIRAAPWGISDGNGLPDPLVLSYQWYRADGNNLYADPGQVDTGITYTLLPGATHQSYTPQAADADHHLMVRVSFTDDAGNREHLYVSPLRKVRSVAENSPNDGQESDLDIYDESSAPSSDLSKSLVVLSEVIVHPEHAAAQAAYDETLTAEEQTAEEDDEEGPPDAPDAPENLVVTGWTSRSASLAWDDPGDGSVVGYQVLRRSRDGDDRGDNEGAPEFVVVGETDSSVTSYTDPTLTFRWRYTFRVRAYNAGGVSEWSNLRHVETRRRPANNNATGAPTVTGTVRVGETLGVDTSGIADKNGLQYVQYTYQWLVDSVVVEGETGAEYTVPATDFTKTIKVRVSFLDDALFSETLTSPGAGPVANNTPPSAPQNLVVRSENTSGVTLDWELPVQGDVAGYQVLRRTRPTNGGSTRFEVVGETGRLVTTHTDTTISPGGRYHYQVRARNFSGTGPPSSQVNADIPHRPANQPATGTPTIGGTPQVGQTLTAHTTNITDANGLQHGAFTHQWLADNTNIPGATHSTHTLTTAQLAKTITVQVWITDDAGHVETLTSTATAAVTPGTETPPPPDPPTPAPPGHPTNLTVRWVTHDAVTLIWDQPTGNPVTSYQILRRTRSGTPEEFTIVGETGSPATIHTDTTVTPNTPYSYRVQARNPGGTSPVSRYANADTPSQPINHTPTGTPTIGGSARVGGTLTAGTTNIKDANGLDNVTYTYQWLADNTNIPGATHPTHTLTTAQLAKTIKIQITFTDDHNHPETLTSNPVGPVDHPISQHLTEQEPTGDEQTGDEQAEDEQTDDQQTDDQQTDDEPAVLPDPPDAPENLVVTGWTSRSASLAWDDPGDGSVVGYQVLRRSRDGDDRGDNEGAPEFVVVGETDSSVTSYTDPTLTFRWRYTFRVRAYNAGGVSEWSNLRHVETRRRPANNNATGAPTVTGTVRVGETLGVDTSGIADKNGLQYVQYTYQWLVDSVVVEGETGAEYTVPATDFTKTIKVRVSFLDDALFSETLTSPGAGPVANNTPPSAPQNLVVRSENTSGVTLDWELPVQGDVAGYQVLRRTRPTNGGSTRFEVVGETGRLVTTHTDTTISPGGRYHYQVRARNFSGTGPPSSQVNADIPHRPANQPATGTPTIGGTPQVGQTLTAHTTNITDANGLQHGAFTHQWLADNTNIPGATHSTHTLTTAQLAKTITVQVWITDDAGHVETLTSTATAAVTPGTETPPPPDPPTPAPPGHPTNLTVRWVTHDAVTLIWDQPTGNPVTSYQILRRTRSGTPEEFTIVGETGSPATIHTDTTVTPNTPYSYRVQARNPGGTSPVSRYANADTPSQPINHTPTGTPTIGGSARVGGTLTAGTTNIKDANGLDNVTYTYQWLADNTNIPGATHPTHTLTTAQLAKTIKIQITFTDDHNHPETLTSNPVGPVDHPISQSQAGEPQTNRAATGAPTIGGTARVGETLTAGTSGIVDGNGLANVSYTYQWLADDTDISGATSSGYTVAEADLNKTIKVRVSFTDDDGHAETLTSAGVGPVEEEVTPDPPSQPWRLLSFPGANNSVRLIWESPRRGTADSYQVLRRSGDGDVYGDSLGAGEYVVVGETDSSATTYTDTTVKPRTRYAYRVKARNAGGLGPRSGMHLVDVPDQSGNHPATGAPTVSGTARVGETLTADTSGIADGNGLDNVSYTYQWLADDTDISDATGSGYTVAEDDLNKTIKVRVSFTDDDNNTETLTSAGVGPVEQEPVTPDPPSKPQNLRVSSETHSSVILTWDDPDDSTISSYQVLRRSRDGDVYGDGAGAAEFVAVGETGSSTTTYTDTTVTPRTKYVYRVKARNAGGLSPQSGYANAETPVRPNRAATGAPTIAGTAGVGQTLTADTTGIADEDGLENVSYTYQWLADDTNISDATAATHTLTAADLNKTIKIRVSFTDDAGFAETLTSAGVGPVDPQISQAQENSPATGAPTIGGTARVGETLTADTTGIADEDGLDNVTYTYQWLADDTEISGATAATHTLAHADLNKTIKIRVSFTDDAGHAETLTSAGVGPVDPQISQAQLGPNTVTPPPVGGLPGSVQRNIPQKANHPATGVPAIGPSEQGGRTLAVDISGIADLNGLDDVSYTYQWLVDDTEVDGATADTYTVPAADRHRAIGVQVSFTDDAGHPETLTSPPFHPTRANHLTATVTDGGVTLTWQAPVDYPYLVGYQIGRHRPEAGETEPLQYVDTRTTQTTYLDADVQPGVLYVYTVRVASYFSTSYPSPPVEIRFGNSPATGVPAIGPSEQGGRTLAVDVSGIADLNGLDDVSFTYQWLVDDTEVDGATADTYTVPAADRHRAIGVQVSFTDDAGHPETLTSPPFHPTRANHLTATVTDGGVALTWQAPVDYPYLVGYQIGRHRPEAGETEPLQYVDTRTTQTTYFDADVEPGVLYVYTVRVASFFSTSYPSLPLEIRAPEILMRPATGAPRITGLAAAGETLEVDVSGIADEDGLENVSYSYQWLADGDDISGATAGSYTLTESDAPGDITVRVSFTDDAGHPETLTSRPLLTAGVHDVPDSHDGETAFTFELRFSEEPTPDSNSFSYRTLLYHAFTVTGGRVITAKRMEGPEDGQNKNIRWAITVEPDTSGAVTVVLPVTGNCEDTGAICTDDGRMLSTRLEVVVRPAG